MPDTKTSAEITRSPFDGTELCRLATPASNWKATLASIFQSNAFFATSTVGGTVPPTGGGTTNFLRADGTWAAPPGGGGTPGNPTALVGTSAINGVASTFMRSDAAPAINQAMNPQWSGKHTFGGGFAPVLIDGGPSYVQTAGDVSSFNWQQSYIAYQNTTRGAYMAFAKTRGSTPSTHIPVVNGDILSALSWYGSDGTDYINGAAIQIHVDGPVSANTVPMNMAFFTGPSTDVPYERFRIDSNGTLITNGVVAQTSISGQIPPVQFHGEAVRGPTSVIGSYAWGNANNASSIYFLKSHGGGVIGTQGIVANLDLLGSFLFAGSDGVTFRDAAHILAFVDGVPAVNSVPSALRFDTTPVGGTSPLERMRIDGNGYITVGGFANTPINAEPSHFQIALSDSAYCGTWLQYGNNGNDPSFAFVKTRGATPTTQGAVINTDWLGEIDFVASDGTTWQTTAFINAVVNGTVAAGSVPTDLLFHTGSAPAAPERLRIDSVGRVIIGGTTVGGWHSNPSTFQLNYANTGPNLADGPTAQIVSFGSSLNIDPQLVMAFSRGTTLGSQVIVGDGDVLGEIDFAGSDGTQFREAAEIWGMVDGTPGAGSMPGMFSFRTSPAGSVTTIERMVIDSTGAVIIGVPSANTGTLKLANASSANLTTIQAGNAVAARTYIWPTDFGVARSALIDLLGNGVLTWGVVIVPTVADQPFSGGFTITSNNQGTKSSGTYTIDPGVCPLQYITNNGAFTLAAPVNDGSCLLLITNGASAGVITFTGFSVPTSPGDALDTVSGHVFTLSIWRINGVSGYRAAAMQ